MRTAAQVSLLAATCWACSGVSEPPHSGGQPLPGTEDAICQNDTGFFLSPDGRRLVFEIGDRDAPDYVAFGEPHYAVSDTETLERHEVAIAPEVVELSREQEGPMAARACWSADGRRLYFPGPNRGSWFAIDVSAGSPVLVASEPPACAAEDDGRQPADGRVELRQPAPRTIEITAPGGRPVLAEHRAEDGAATRIHLTHSRPSPDGRFLSYVVTDMQGSFATPSRGFVLDLNGAPASRPLQLAAPVFGPLRWAPDNTLYACVGGRRSMQQIVRWQPQTLAP